MMCEVTMRQTNQILGSKHSRNYRKTLLAMAIAVVGTAGFVNPVSAANKYWDLDGSTTGLQAGNGGWDTGVTSLWSTAVGGTALTTWTSGDDAYFNAASGTSNVTLGGTIVANSLNIPTTTAVNISSGTLQLGTGGINQYAGSAGPLAISSAMALNGNQTWALRWNVSKITVTGNISEAVQGNNSALTIGLLPSSNGGNVVLSGSNSYAGGTILNGGTQSALIATAGSNTAFGTGTLTLAGGTLADNTAVNLANAISATSGTTTYLDSLTGNLTLSGNISGSGAITQKTSGSGYVYLAGSNNSYNGTFTYTRNTYFKSADAGSANASFVGTGGGLTLDFGGGTIHFGTLSSTVNYASIVPTANTGNYTIVVGERNEDSTFNSQINQANSTYTLTLVKAGTGVLTLTNTNSSYNGGTTITGGTLSISKIANDWTNSLLGQTGKITLDGGTLLYTGTGDSSNRNLTLGLNGGVLDASGTGALSLTSNSFIGLVAGGARTFTLTGTNSAANTYAGKLADSTGATSLVKNGVGAWTLTGASTHTGGTTVNAGTLNASAASALGTAGTVTVNTNGTLNATATNALTSAVTLNINGGTAVLSTSNNYTGGTLLTAGSLRLGHANALGTGALTINGGTLDLGGTTAVAITSLSGTGGSITTSTGSASFTATISTASSYAGTINGNVAFTKAGTATFTLTGSSSYTGGTTISAGALQLVDSSVLGTGSITNNATLIANPTTSLTISNNITGTGTFSQMGAGTTILAGSNTSTGSTSIYAGTLQTNQDNALSSGALAVSGTLNLNGHSNNVGTLSGSGTITSSTAGGRLVTTGTADSTFTGSLTGAMGLTVSGSKVLTLPSANSYTGGTTINSGVRVILGDNNSLGTGPITFNGGSLDTPKDVNITLTNPITVANNASVSFKSNNSAGSTGTFAINGNISGGAGATISFSANAFSFGGDNSTFAGTVTPNQVITLTSSTAGSPLALWSSNNIWGPIDIKLGATGSVHLGALAGTLPLDSKDSNYYTVILGEAGLTAVHSGSIGNISFGYLNILMSGTGTQTLAGQNTYVGTTTIESGTLIVGDNSTSTATQFLTADPGSTGTVNKMGATTLTVNSTNGVGIGSKLTSAVTGVVDGTVVTAILDSTHLAISTPLTTDIPSGKLIYPKSALGDTSSAITLGTNVTTTNNANPTLFIGGAFTVARPITVANFATAGKYTIGGNTDNTATFSGLVTLNQPLTVSQSTTTGTNSLYLSGGIKTSSTSGAQTVTFAGPGAITVSGSVADYNAANPLAVSVTGGTVTFAGASTSYTGATSISAGTLKINNNCTLSTGPITNNAALQINAASANITNLDGSGSTTIGDGTSNAALTSNYLRQNTLTLNANSTAILRPNGTSSSVSNIGALSLAPTAKLDLADNDLILRTGTYADWRQQLADGRNGGLWNGTHGLVSNAAATAAQAGHELTGLALVRNGDLPDGPLAFFDGQNVTPDSLLIKYTYAGDANLDGTITMDDYLAIDTGYLFGGSTYTQGDFNYDGQITGADYAIIDYSLAHHGNPLAEQMMSLHASWFGAEYTSALTELATVPEPATLSLLGLGALCLLRRRR